VLIRPSAWTPCRQFSDLIATASRSAGAEVALPPRVASPRSPTSVYPSSSALLVETRFPCPVFPVPLPEGLICFDLLSPATRVFFFCGPASFVPLGPVSPGPTHIFFPPFGFGFSHLVGRRRYAPSRAILRLVVDLFGVPTREAANLLGEVLSWYGPETHEPSATPFVT